ncbi:MAG TPA: hypothetical protein VHM19_06420 [Polyangiales bacterium]|jgi:flavodoxin|nr:hypothetical protein [Polyangiales bacterium]
MPTPKILVVYYSRSGNTQEVARAISERLDCGAEPILDRTDRRGIRGWLRSGRDGWKQRTTEIVPMASRAEDYDLVIVGTPVWASSLSAPVRTYLQSVRGKAKRVAFFLTYGGSGQDRVFTQMQAAVGQPPIAVLAITERQLDSGEYRTRAHDLARAVRQIFSERDELLAAMAS